MIRKLLVANRGEIALRVFRACRSLGIATVAVVAPDDKGSLHARSADETVEIASYLFSEEHIRAAKQTDADAIHPGYGFLAENPDFAEAVGAAELVWERAHDRRRNVIAYFQATPHDRSATPAPQVEEDIDAAEWLDPVEHAADVHPLHRAIFDRWWRERQNGFHLNVLVHVAPDGTQSYSIGT